jgi:hypothetical protein
VIHPLSSKEEQLTHRAEPVLSAVFQPALNRYIDRTRVRLVKPLGLQGGGGYFAEVFAVGGFAEGFS